MGVDKDRLMCDPFFSKEGQSGRAGIHATIRDSKAVLFDFDFTLADSSVGIIACINYALTKIGLPESPPDEILETVGLFIPEALVALAGEEYRPRGQEFLKRFTEKADEVIIEGTRLFPPTAKVIPALDRFGYRVGIVSTKYRYRIESIMEWDGLLDCLDVIIGGEDVTRHKPDPEGLILAAGKLGVEVGDCVYVGDSHVDAGAAQSAGMPFVAVLSGSTPVEIFADYPNVAILPGVEGIAGEPLC